MDYQNIIFVTTLSIRPPPFSWQFLCNNPYLDPIILAKKAGRERKREDHTHAIRSK